MTNATTRRSYRVLIATIVVALLAGMFTVLSKPNIAFAECDGSQGSFGCGDQGGSPGDGNGGSGGEGTRPGAPNPGTGGNPSPPDPYLKTVRNIGNQGTCMDRAEDGKPSNGWDEYYKAVFYLNWDKDQSPGSTWEYTGFYPGFGHQWKQWQFAGMRCLYPPKTQLVTQPCIISTTAVVDMVAPRQQNLASSTTLSGYAENSDDWDSCVRARSYADASLSIWEQGFYHASVRNKVQNVVFEISLTADEVTGEMPGPKRVGASPAYMTTPSYITGSLHCSTGWVSPAMQKANYADTTGCEKTPDNPNGIFQCSADDVARVNGFDARKKLHPFTGKTLPFVEIMGDGSRNKVTYNQRVSGNGLAVESYRTRFSLSPESSPFVMVGREGFVTPGSLLTEVFRGANDNSSQNIMGVNRNTTLLSEKVDEVYISPYTESSQYQISGEAKGLELTQQLTWAGKLTWQSVRVTGLAPGQYITVPETVVTPVEGVCNATAYTTAIRAKGDKIS